MAISVLSSGYIGLDSYVVEVEVDVSNGLPIFNIVGMGDLAILESKERVRSCFKNIGVEFSQGYFFGKPTPYFKSTDKY